MSPSAKSTEATNHDSSTPPAIRPFKIPPVPTETRGQLACEQPRLPHQQGCVQGCAPIAVVPPVATSPARTFVQRPGSFKVTPVGKTSRAQSLRITNRGGSPLGALRVSAEGNAKRDSLLSQPARKNLAPGESTTFKVSFRPRAKGVRRATLAVRSKATPALRAALSGRAKGR